MLSPRTGSPRRPMGSRSTFRFGLALCAMLPAVGCQVEYAGMTLPSGKYMHDDVQYFQPGPDFPYANTQAATQRANMAMKGMEVPPVPVAEPVKSTAPAVVPGSNVGAGAAPAAPPAADPPK